jgi:hypothetical protein
MDSLRLLDSDRHTTPDGSANGCRSPRSIVLFRSSERQTTIMAIFQYGLKSPWQSAERAQGLNRRQATIANVAIRDSSWCGYM